MRLLCRYSVVETATGIPLVFGEKWKLAEHIDRDYIKSGKPFRVFPRLWQKITFYYRNAEINGVRCVIFLWANNRARRGEPFNCINGRGVLFGLRGKIFYGDEYQPSEAVCRGLIDELGLVSAGVQ